MPGASRKRLRGEAPAPHVAPDIRQTLARRVDPRAARSPQSTGGLSVDDALIHLGRTITAAQESLAESAEGARVQLRESRAALHAAIDARCDDLGESINTAEARKRACLERELVAVDAALESWRAESGAVREAATSLPDSELASQYAALSSRLDAMEKMLQALPTAVVEPPRVGLQTDAPAIHSRIADFGRVIAPLSVTAADLTLHGEPSTLRQGIVQMYLRLGARHAEQSTEELEVSLGMLVGTTIVDSTLEGGVVHPRSLESSITHNAAERCLCISFEVPPFFSSVHIRHVCVTGQIIAGFPLTLSARPHIQAPMQIKGAAVDFVMPPCISPEGRVYCLPGNGPELLIFDFDGTPLPGISVVSAGLSSADIWVAYAPHVDTPLLIVAEAAGRASRIMAIDPIGHSVRWASTAGNDSSFCGIAVLPDLGAVFVSSANVLYAHRLSDGARVGRLSVPGQHWNLTADPSTATIFGTILDQERLVTVPAWACVARGARVLMSSAGVVAAAERGIYDYPLVVVPPAPGKKTSHLVISSQKLSESFVLELPGRSLVHTHRIAGVMKVVGLTADPGGTAIAFCEETSETLHVLGWPLPGMLPLE